MKKFNALLFAMALVAVVAFASVASAATFLGIDKTGNVETITIDPTAGTYTYTGNVTDKKLSIDHRLFTYDGGIVAVSADSAANTGAGNTVDIFKVADDGKVSYYKKISTPGLGDVRAVETLKGNPVFRSDRLANNADVNPANFGKFSFISKDENGLDTFVSKDISVDTMFVHNDKLVVITTTGTTSYISVLSEADLAKSSKDIDGMSFKMLGKTIVSEDHTGASSKSGAKYATAIAGNLVYIANGASIYTIDISEATAIAVSPTVNELTGAKGNYMAMFGGSDGRMFAIKSSDTDVKLVSFTDGVEHVVLQSISKDINADPCGSFDIYYSESDKVLGVINQGHVFAAYVPDGTEKWKFLVSTDKFSSVAMVKTASTTPDTPDTPATSTVVDASKITDTTEVANLTKASGAAGTSAFVAQSDVTESTGTAPSTDTQTAVKEKAGFDNSTVAAVKDYTLAKKGYVLVTTNPGYNAANVKVYFVKKTSSSSASVAAAEESFTASLLDSSYAAISTGTSAYATSTSELEAGDYTLVTVTKTASGEGEGEGESGSTTSSSSGGCDAGFAAVSALLALAFFKKSR